MAIVSFTEQGSGPPLLLVHGVMVTGEMFGPVVARFAEHHRVIVPDLRGHGRSRGLGPLYTVAQLALDLAQLLDHLDVRSTAVLGYSQGGAVAQQLALDHGARCSRLVLACTYAFNAATLSEKLEGHFAPLLMRALGMRRFAKLVVSAGLENAEWLVDIIAAQDRALMTAAWRAAMAFDSRPRLTEIRCPTLVVAGAQDKAVPMHHAHMLHDGIAGSQLIVVEGAGHSLVWTHPTALVSAIEAFLDS